MNALLLKYCGFGSPETKVSIHFSKAKTTFYLRLHCDGDNSYLFINGKEIFLFKSDNKNVNFPAQFCLGSISNKFGAIGSREISLKENVYTFGWL